MSGYLNFKRTGIECVDLIIEALEYAGDSYHHTSQWDEEAFGEPGKTHIELIQEALDNAAKLLMKNKQEVEYVDRC